MTLPSFDEFMAALHGHEPFPWQSRLLNEVTQTGRWPDLIDIPTGLGKTSVLDVAVYVAAAKGVSESSPGRRRIFFVIDRRVVVDEAFWHATRISRALVDPNGSAVLTVIGEQLVANGATAARDRPLVVERMRGGITWSWNWMDRPDRLAIVVGTVDQLGSRFLFRGYGLSPRLAPIDAALCGTDSLIVIDEAHLAEPLRRVVTTAIDLDRPYETLGLRRPGLVVMSATPWQGATGARVFSIDDDEAGQRHPVAGPRLSADKRLHLVSVDKRSGVADVMAAYAMDLAATREGAVVGVVCNTVRALPGEVHRLLQDRGKESILLTGRVRPYDRARNMEQYLTAASRSVGRRMRGG